MVRAYTPFKRIEHFVNGYYVPLGWNDSDPIPLGQAYIVPLVSRCHRMIHQVYGHRYAAALISPIQHSLEDVIDQLKLIVS
jgi:hypothetical protein